jgi:hypothetical protein
VKALGIVTGLVSSLENSRINTIFDNPALVMVVGSLLLLQTGEVHVRAGRQFHVREKGYENATAYNLWWMWSGG